MARDLAREPDDDRTGTPADPSNCGSKSLLNRRNYLRLSAVAAGTVALASGGASAATSRRGISFDRVVDAVEDLGWDPNGNDPIDIPTENGLLIEVPPGEYVFEGTGENRGPVEGDLYNWGLRGTGDHWTDVVFRTSNGKSTRFMNCGWDSDGVLLENVTFDHTDSRTGGDIGHTIRGRDNIEVHDVEHVGMSGKEPYCRWTMHPHVTDPDGVANIVNYRKTGPSVFTGHGGSDGGGGVFSGHEGTANFIDCRIENQGGDGGLYTGKHNGQTNFYGCYFANNDMGVMRMGAGSEMHNCTVVVDWENAHPDNVVLDGDWGDNAPTGTAGVYSTSAQFGKSGGGIYDTDILLKNTYHKGQAAIAINNSEGDMEIKRCHIQCDIDGMPAIWGRNPADQRLSNHETPEKPWGLTIEDCSITGTTDDPAILLDHRHGSVVRNCCIQMDGPGEGIVLESSDDCVVEDTNVNTTGEATVFRNCSASTSNITHGDGCPVPDGTWTKSDGSTETDSTDGSDSDGGSSDGSTTDTPPRDRDGTVELTADSGPTWYHIKAGEAVDPGAKANLTDPTADAYADRQLAPDEVVGCVGGGGVDSWEITGGIEALSTTSPMSVTVAGDTVDLSSVASVEYTRWPSDPDAGWTESDLMAPHEADGTVELTADSGPTWYHIKAGEAVDPGAKANLTDPTADAYADRQLAPDEVVGCVGGGGVDSWEITGGIVEFSATQSMVVTLAGEAVDPGAIADVGTPGWPSDPDAGWTESDLTDDGSTSDGSTSDSTSDAVEATELIEIVGQGEYATYEFSVDGALEGDSLNAEDEIAGTDASGAVSGGTDSYLFGGSITAFSADGPVTVAINGEEVDPSTLGISRTLTVVGFGESASYSFSVSGAIENNPDEGTFDTQDNISGASAEGAVLGGTDGYRFSGDVESFTLQGEAAVYVDGRQVAPDRLGTDQPAELPNVLVVDGTGVSGQCDYRFAVSGAVAKSVELGTVESADTIDATSVAGTVESEADAYRFSGDITAFDMDGSASIRFEDNDG